MTDLFVRTGRLAALRPLVGLGLLALVGCSQGERTDFLSPNPNSNLPVLSLIRVEPQINSVQVGSEIQFTATGYSTGGQIIPVNVDWMATGGMITADGRYTGVLTGTFTVRAVSREKPSVADSARVGVWESGDELVALVVAPDSAVIDEGESVNFQAALRMARGALTGSAAVNWSASGGEMSPSGRFTAAEAGEYVISALSVNNLRASARVFVRKRILQLRRVSTAPASATMRPNRDTTFSATAEWSNGSVSAAAVDWSSTGGTVNYAGVYRSGGSPGDFVVVATDRATGLADTSRVAVVPPSLTRVTVAPKTLSLAPGAHQQFVAQAQLDDGTWGSAQVVWEASGGQVTQSGGFTAPSNPGVYRVIVSSPTMSMYGGVAAATGSALADTAMITVVQPAATLTGVTVNPSSVVIQAGGQRSFSAIGTWSDGSTSVPAVTWTATGGTVDASGNYTAGVVTGSFRVIATAPSGLADTSNVTITGAVPVSLALTPEMASLQSGQTVQFSAIATMSTGGSSAPAVTYSAQGGTISAGGLYTAGGSPGTYTVVATLAGGGLADTSLVTIASAPPVLTGVVLTPTSAVLAPGGSQQFNAAGLYSNGGTAPIAATWSATGGSVSSSGLYTAGSTPGVYRIIARQTGHTRADTSVITITSPPTVTSIAISPKPASVQTGGTQQFSATATWSDGSTEVPPLVWTATGGSVANDGLYTAGPTAGTYRVVATLLGGTKSDTSVVTLTAPPSPQATLVSLTITPKPTSLQTGGTRQFSASAVWSDGSTTLPAVTWAATGGTITAGGFYRAGSASGTFRAIVSGGGKADTSLITVTAPPAPTLTSLTISPSSVALQTGGSQQFTASATWSDGSSGLPSITWNATGGTITAGGLYSAGSSAGTYRVIVSGSGRADTASVGLSAPPPSSTACPAYPGSIWCDDFEQNRLSSYFEVDNNGGDFARTAGVGFNGSTGMRARWQTGEVGAGSLKLAFGRTPTSYMRPVDAGTANYREIFWRMYLKHEAGWQGGGADKLTRATVFANGNWAQAMFGHLWSGGVGNNYLVIDPASGTDAAGALKTATYNDFANMRWLGAVTGPTPIFDAAHVGQWYCVEAHVMLNSSGSSNGLFEVWVNDNLEMRQTNMNWLGSYGAYGINAIFFENYWNVGSPRTQERYFDNIVVGTQRIGCETGSGGSTPTLTSLVLSPAGIALAPGGSQAFTATATWSDGSTTVPAITWTATGGTISTSGQYTAGATAGSFTVTATGGGRVATATVTISGAPATLTALTVAPKPTSLTAGSTRQFSASAQWSNGSTALPALTWSATGGSISSSGLYTAGSTPGTYRAVVSGGGRADTAVVTVTAAAVTAFQLSPGAVSLQPGATQQFTAAATWSDGVSRAVTVTYAATGGTVSTNGLFTAGSALGTFAVIATCACGSADTSVVTVASAQTSEPSPGGTILFDTRAGGAESYQSRTALSQLQSLYPERRLSGGSSEFLESNVDGNGTHARGIQWASANGAEQEAMWGKYMAAGSDGWYTSWKMYLGKSPTGSGSGSTGQFNLNGNPGQHQKVMLWMRGDVDANGGSYTRMYLCMTPGGTNLRIDGLNYNSPMMSINPLSYTGQVQKWTVYIQPSSGTVKVWFNGALVMNASGQNIGSTGLSQIQQTATTFPGQQQVQYTWDMVVWR